jgi:hypothetical protein
MKTAIVVLIVLAAALALYFVLAGTGRLEHVGGFTPPPEKDGKPDKDAMGSWKPPPVANAFGDLAAPFAPHADLGAASASLPPGAERTLTAAPSNKDMRIAAFNVTAGAVAVSYACTRSNGDDCSESECLCAAGAPISPLKLGACPTAFRSAVDGSNRCAGDAKAKGTIVVYREASQVSLANLGPADAQVSLR